MPKMDLNPEAVVQTQTQTYQVIPRKFRPQTFEAVVGQEAIVTTLKNALRFNRLAHAYLFSGCRGTGKTTLARVFAKALNCQNLTADLEPCNACHSCLEIISGRSLDVLEIDGASNRGIDDIRQINETIGYTPASGKFKIYIIDEVHMLTKEAFNALLKTLEEPPSKVKFFFATTEPHRVLPTIISRCQRFDLNRIAQTAMVQKLAYIAKNLDVECQEEALSLIAYLSEGSLRDAESLMDQVICYAEQPISAEGVSNTLGLMPKESFFALDKAVSECRCSFAFELSQTLFSSGKDLSYFLDHLLEHFRTLLLIKFGKPCFFLNATHEERYKSAASLYSEEQCLSILDYLIQWQQQVLKSPFKRIGLEMILLHLIRSKNRVTFGALVKKLSEIQEQIGLPPPSAMDSAPAPKISLLPATITSSPAESAPPAPSVEELLLNKVKTQLNRGPTINAGEPNQNVSAPVGKDPAALESGNEKDRFDRSPERQHAWTLTDSDPLIPQLSTQTIMNPTEQPQKKPAHHNVLSCYETLIRFASVELEGVIK